MSLCETYPYTTAREVNDHLADKHGGLYVLGYQSLDDPPTEAYTGYLSGTADLLHGFLTHELRVTYFAVWKEGTCE